MTYNPHTWVNGEIITAEKLNNLEQGAGQAAQPGPKGEKGNPGKSLYVASSNVGAESSVKRTDITRGAEVVVGDWIIDVNGKVYEVKEATGDTITVGNMIMTLKGPAGAAGGKGDKGDPGAGLTGTASVLAALAPDADAAMVRTKVNEIINILNTRGVSKVS